MAGRNESFFHGTASNISDAVRPGVQVGHSIWRRMGEEQGQPSEQHAFATTDEDEAWGFAQVASAVQQSRYTLGMQASRPGRARVYTVAPHPEMRLGIHHPSHPEHEGLLSGELHEYIAPEFKVTGHHDIRPGHQGTFPTINWRQFSHPDISGDPNHPIPEEVAHGMRFTLGSPMGKRQSRLDEKAAAGQKRKAQRVEVSGQMDLLSGRVVR